jgi:hypothetical protein
MTDLKALAADFPRDAVSWRAQSLTKDGTKALALAYIDARDVMERLDAVCGPAGWQCDYPHAAAKTVCRIGIKIGDEWVWKSNGAGDSDIEAEKGALSDAFKRAAVLWGIGRYLYTIESPWVPCEAYETEHQGKKKWNWKRWTASPWNFVKGAKAEQAPLAAQLSESLVDELKKKLEGAKTQADLRRIWRENADAIGTLAAEWQEGLTDYASGLKTKLSANSNLGAHLDNIEREAAH